MIFFAKSTGFSFSPEQDVKVTHQVVFEKTNSDGEQENPILKMFVRKHKLEVMELQMWTARVPLGTYAVINVITVWVYCKGGLDWN